MKKILKIAGKIVSIILGLFVVLVCCKIVGFQLYSIKNIRVENGIMYGDLKIERKKHRNNHANIMDKNEIIAVDSLNIIYNGININISNKIYEKALRYYIAIEDITNNFNKEFKEDNNIIYLDRKKLIDIDLHRCYINDAQEELRGEILREDNNTYICLNDLENILGLRLQWDFKENLLYIFNENHEITRKLPPEEGSKVAFLRLEDVTAGGIFSRSDNMEKFKIVGDFLYSQGIRFHVAWVPRYINPSKGIDNNLLTNNSIENVAFINMLDHLIYRGASIGLHGYTHQVGKTITADGNELTYKDNTTEEEVIRIAESSINAAKQLNIPIDFFESPHYKATRKQQKILEKYFDIMYEPYSGYWNMNPIISLDNKSTVYVPAPLKRIKDEYGQELCNNIIKNPKWRLTSFFIHPYKELNFINFDTIDENGYLEYHYDENSPIHNVVNTLNENGFITGYVSELIGE